MSTEPEVRAARPEGVYSLGLALVSHLVIAILVWSVVAAPDRTVVYNEDFERWAWIAGIVGAVLAVGVGIWRRSWKATVLASLGVGAAVLLELAVFVTWIVSHSQ